ISATYINSSFDKWFSIKIQNTLQASIEITHTYYRNADETAMHFAEHLSGKIRDRLQPPETWRSGYFSPVPGWLDDFLTQQQDLLALDSVEYYRDPFDDRVIVQRADAGGRSVEVPRLPLELLNRAFAGERVSAIQHIGNADLIRSL